MGLNQTNLLTNQNQRAIESQQILGHQPELEHLTGMELKEISVDASTHRENGEKQRPSSAAGITTMMNATNVRALRKNNKPYESLRYVQINSMVSAASANEFLQDQPMPQNLSQENFHMRLNSNSAMSGHHQRNRLSMQDSGNLLHKNIRQNTQGEPYTINQNQNSSYMQRANSMMVNSHRLKQRYV